MSYHFSPRIVTDGLVMCLDAANPKSYSSSSTSWNDLSKIGVNTTLVNGPTFNSANGGSIVFDGVNDYCEANDPLNLSGTNRITLDVWMRFASTSISNILEQSINFNSNNSFLFYTGEFGTGRFIIADRVPAQGYNVAYTNASYNDGKWHNCIATIDRGLSATDQNKLYVDSVLDTVVHPTFRTDLSSSFSSHDLYIGARAGSTTFYNGNIAIIKIYRRVLSSSEILQNFNATKNRFGL